MIRIRVPGSTANLGPGFDAVGLALDRYLDLSDEPFEGAQEVSESGLVRIAARQAGNDSPMFASSTIPVGKGFGSSAAEAVGGAYLARLCAGDDEPTARAAAFAVGNEIEGHADNAAPSAFGGLCLAVQDRVHYLTPKLDGLSMLIWVPDSVNETKAARGVIRQSLDLSEAIQQSAATAALIAGLLTGDIALLAESAHDVIHEQARLEFLPETKFVLDRLREAGFAAWLSGSGPSVAAITPLAVASDCAAAMTAEGDVFEVVVDTHGCQIIR